MPDVLTKSNPQQLKAGPLQTAVNILTSPGEAFTALQTRPTFVFPLTVILLSTMATMGWYFASLDYSWFIDDTLGQLDNLTDTQIEQARERMESLSQRNMRLLGVFGSAISLIVIYVLQAGYLALVSALTGDNYRFRHWFSLSCWTNMTYLLVVISMLVNIYLNPSGQLSATDLNALSLSSLGIQSTDASIERILSTVNLTMFWSLGLTLAGYRQWLQSTWKRAASIVITPYLVIFGVWAYFALNSTQML